MSGAEIRSSHGAAARSLGGQALRYGVVGLGNTAVGYTVILASHAAGCSLLVANLLGFGFGLVVSYLGNRAWTFGRSGLGLREVPAYAAVVAASFVLNYLSLLGLLHVGLPFPAAQAVGIAVYSATLFLGLRNVVFASA